MVAVTWAGAKRSPQVASKAPMAARAHSLISWSMSLASSLGRIAANTGPTRGPSTARGSPHRASSDIVEFVPVEFVAAVEVNGRSATTTPCTTRKASAMILYQSASTHDSTWGCSKMVGKWGCSALRGRLVSAVRNRTKHSSFRALLLLLASPAKHVERCANSLGRNATRPPQPSPPPSPPPAEGPLTTNSLKRLTTAILVFSVFIPFTPSCFSPADTTEGSNACSANATSSSEEEDEDAFFEVVRTSREKHSNTSSRTCSSRSEKRFTSSGPCDAQNAANPFPPSPAACCCLLDNEGGAAEEAVGPTRLLSTFTAARRTFQDVSSSPSSPSSSSS
mmetsp:Transcript_45704/g.90105  ORF Transcript_45704/g.90105 Transcript_45704/m.90105 type:complete len:336 (-) Transcript_45704:1168-2175(-)